MENSLSGFPPKLILCSIICPHTSTKGREMERFRCSWGLEEEGLSQVHLHTPGSLETGATLNSNELSFLQRHILRWQGRQEKFLGQCGSYSEMNKP